MSKPLPKPPTVTVVMRNLPAGTTEQEILDLCYNCGGVAEVEIPARVSLYTKFIYA
ncbi:hypothetical protein SK128_012927 [Halocaridina rubra]|uniref:RRM domain-containing protein n=1 Tax=Halocaridina rubra TaxID=373956 RepID=A0AAN9ABJ9_HALRR